MYSNLHQEPQETQESDTFEPNELPQQKQTSAPIGLDDITISEELEDESLPDATPGCKDLLKRKEITKNEEPSPEPIKASEAELEPEKEKPEKEKSTSTDSPNPDKSNKEYHDSFKQQEFKIELDDFLWPIDSDDYDPQDDYDLVTYKDLAYIKAIKPK